MANVLCIHDGSTAVDWVRYPAFCIYSHNEDSFLGGITYLADASVNETSADGLPLVVFTDHTDNLDDIETYADHWMDTHSIGCIVCHHAHGASPDDRHVTDNYAYRLGLIAECYADAKGTGAGYYGDRLLWGDVVMCVGAEDNIMASGFHTAYQPHWGRTAAISTHFSAGCPGSAAVAGTPLFESSTATIGGQKSILASVVSAGDAKVGVRFGETFSTNAGWCGFDAGGGLNWYGGVVMQGIASYAAGNFYAAQEATPTYSTTETSAIRFEAVDLSGLALYKSAALTWTENLPANTSVTVKYSRDGETWYTATNGVAFASGWSLNDDLTDEEYRWCYVLAILATSDGVSTPWIEDIELDAKGNSVELTDTPADYFEYGPLKWLTGNNAGRAMEVKDYTSGTQTMTLFLAMPYDIQVGDTFEVSAGCDKTIAMCNSKFSNQLNFQGEPHVPGEDVTLKAPDAT